MTGVHDSPAGTRSDAIAEILSADSCHLVLDTSPTDYVQTISRYLETSVGQSRPSEVYNEPAEAESDSGDSLFLTQKPVPEAVRSTRRLHYSLRSNPVSPRGPEGSEDDIVLSSSHGNSKPDRERRRKQYRRPKYSFPFLSERKWKPRRSATLAVHKNTSLHNAAMGGFFTCVAELWKSCQSGEHLESSLPTVDMEGEYISPLSEEEEDRSEDEDIKVVEKKRFVAPSKAKRRQSWCNQLKPQRRKKAGTAGQETSQGRQWNTLHELPTKASTSRVTALSLNTEKSDDGESSCRVLPERCDEHVTSDRNFLVQTETPKKNRLLTQGNKKIQFQQNTWQDELCDDSDALVCEPHKQQRSSRQCTQKGREASRTVTEPQTDVSCTDHLSQTGEAEDEPESQSLLHSLPDFISDTNNDRVRNETRVKNNGKGDCESLEEDQEKGQIQEEPQGVHAATSVNVEVEETPSLSEDNRAEPPAPEANDELDFNENNWMKKSSHDDDILRQEESNISDSKPKKRKRKKNKSAADNVRQEVDGTLESDVRMEASVFPVSGNVENGVEQKKKKRKQSGEDDDDVERLQSSAVAEPQNDDAEVPKKKRKKEKSTAEECDQEEVSNRSLDLPPLSTGQLEESGNGSESTAASQEASESSHVKRKKHKKKQQPSPNEAAQDGEEGVDVSCSNGAVTLAESTGTSLKKKKKKSVSEWVDVSHTPEEEAENIDNTQITKEGIEDQSAELVTKKKKKKKKISEICSRNISKDDVAQRDDSVSLRTQEKKRTSSFLVADAEENVAQTNKEQHSPADAQVWGEEKAGVSVGDFQTDSAEIAGNLEESNNGVRKKKKRKMSVVQDSVEKDHEPDVEEPNGARQSTLPEITDVGVKRKKKRMENERGLVTSMERLECAADAGHTPADKVVVLKKKKKKCKDEPCHVIQESPPKKKGKQLNKETLNMVEHASPSSETPGNEALNDKRDKKNIKFSHGVLLEGKSSTRSVHLEPPEKKKKKRKKQSAVPDAASSSPMLSEISLSKPEMASSDRIVKKKHMKLKRRLYNPSENFLTDFLV